MAVDNQEYHSRLIADGFAFFLDTMSLLEGL